MTSTLVRKYINERPLGAVFTARECMNFGNSTAVYKCLLRATRDGCIVRVAWGAYYRPDPRRPGYLPPLDEIVSAKDRAFGRTTMSHECELLDDIMAMPILSSWGSSSDDLEHSCCHGSMREPASPHKDDRSASKESTTEDSSAKDDERTGDEKEHEGTSHKHDCASRHQSMNAIEESTGIEGFCRSVAVASNSKTVSLVLGKVQTSTAGAVLKYQTGAIDVIAGSVKICVSTAQEQGSVATTIETLKASPPDKDESPEFVTVCIPAAQEHVSEPAAIETLDEIRSDNEGAKCVMTLVPATHKAVSKSPVPSKLSSAAIKPLLHLLMSDTADTPTVCLDSGSKAAAVAIEGPHDSLAAVNKTDSTTTTSRQKRRRELKDAIYDTDGNTSSFNTIHGRVYLHGVSARKMKLGDSDEGKVLRALWCVGASNLKDTHIFRGMNSLGRREKERLRARLWLTPNWLKDALVREYIWKYARPAA